jgi:hypothetical protein
LAYDCDVRKVQQSRVDKSLSIIDKIEINEGSSNNQSTNNYNPPLPLGPPDNPLYSFGSGFIDFFKAIPKAIISPFEYFKNNTDRTVLRDVANGSGIVATTSSGIAVGSYALAAGLAMTGIGLPLAGALVGVGTVATAISGISGLVGLSTSLAQDSKGNLTTNPRKDITNNLLSSTCGEKGGVIDDNDNYKITDGWYCTGNAAALVGSIYASKKLIQKGLRLLPKELICVATTDNPILKYLSNWFTIESEAISCIKLQPNTRYITNPDFDYHMISDEFSRIKQVSAQELKLKPGPREPHIGSTPDKGITDHAGHIIADMFGGSGNLDNLVSMNNKVNLSQYKRIENRWATLLKADKKVRVQIDLNYEGGSKRPSSFDIRYWVDDKKTELTIVNN